MSENVLGKKESPVKRARLPFLVGAVVLAAAIALLNITWLTVLGALLTVEVFWFFRDPERTIPQGENLVVSPADGKILSVTETDEHRFLNKRAKKISIFLNIFDVHVNRLPASGKIRGITYQPGKFLAANKLKEGVQTTASGLQYKVLTMGEGAKPAATDTVEVHYRGTLLDGTEFDSSYARNEPISFALNRVIAGWTEGVQLMPIGSKFVFYIAPDLAYGEAGGGPIPPNSTLVFEVELLDIESQ